MRTFIRSAVAGIVLALAAGCMAQPLIGEVQTCAVSCYTKKATTTACYAECNTSCSADDALTCQGCCDTGRVIAREVGGQDRELAGPSTSFLLDGNRFTGTTLTGTDAKVMVWFGWSRNLAVRNFVVLLAGQRIQAQSVLEGNAKAELHDFLGWALKCPDASTRWAAIQAIAGAGLVFAGDEWKTALTTVAADRNETKLNRAGAMQALDGWRPPL